MNAILRISVAVWSIVFVATTIPASLLSATPLYYQIEMVVELGSPATPLDDATLKLDLTWDASTLTPPSFGQGWPTSNTTGSLTVSGSAAVDGVYSPTFPYPDGASRWDLYNGGALGDAIRFPLMWFEIGGKTIQFDKLNARFGDTFFDGLPPIYPKPFESAEATWDLLTFSPQGGTPYVGAAAVFSGSARYVPEPAALGTASFALLSLAVLRRRK